MNAIERFFHMLGMKYKFMMHGHDVKALERLTAEMEHLPATYEQGVREIRDSYEDKRAQWKLAADKRMLELRYSIDYLTKKLGK